MTGRILPQDGGLETLSSRLAAEITPRFTQLFDPDDLDVALDIGLDDADAVQ